MGAVALTAALHQIYRAWFVYGRLPVDRPPQSMTELNQGSPLRQPKRYLPSLSVDGGVRVRLAGYLDDLSTTHGAIPHTTHGAIQRKRPDRRVVPRGRMSPSKD
jgi:hypothetical protein